MACHTWPKIEISMSKICISKDKMSRMYKRRIRNVIRIRRYEEDNDIKDDNDDNEDNEERV